MILPLRLARFSFASYFHKEALMEKSDPDLVFMKDTTNFQFFCSEKSAQAFVVVDDDTVVFSCRGTDSVKDVIYDLKAGQAWFKTTTFPLQPDTSRVHEGLFMMYLSIEDDIIREISELTKNTDRKIHCTGHSAGAAVAMFAALTLQQYFPGKVSYTGFGSPKVGNPEFCAFYASQSIPSELYVNGADPIAKLLPIKEYAHVCATIHIGEQDLSPNLPLLIDLPEHDMACYLESMQNPDSIKKENSFILFLKRMQRWIFILISNYE